MEARSDDKVAQPPVNLSGRVIFQGSMPKTWVTDYTGGKCQDSCRVVCSAVSSGTRSGLRVRSIPDTWVTLFVGTLNFFKLATIEGKFTLLTIASGFA